MTVSEKITYAEDAAEHLNHALYSITAGQLFLDDDPTVNSLRASLRAVKALRKSMLTAEAETVSVSKRARIEKMVSDTRIQRLGFLSDSDIEDIASATNATFGQVYAIVHRTDD
jgi:hypothetical protein